MPVARGYVHNSLGNLAIRVAPDAPTKPPQFEVDPAWPKPRPRLEFDGEGAQGPAR